MKIAEVKQKKKVKRFPLFKIKKQLFIDCLLENHIFFIYLFQMKYYQLPSHIVKW